MKVRGCPGKDVVVENGDIVDQQKSEPIDAEKAQRNESVKLKENGFIDAKLGIYNKYNHDYLRNDKCIYL